MMPHKNKGYDQQQNYATFAGFVSDFFSKGAKKEKEGEKSISPKFVLLRTRQLIMSRRETLKNKH
jgi:hypothetical protein